MPNTACCVLRVPQSAQLSPLLPQRASSYSFMAPHFSPGLPWTKHPGVVNTASYTMLLPPGHFLCMSSVSSESPVKLGTT